MLKSLVIIMGIMILSGTGFLVYTIATGLHRSIAQEQLPEPVTPSSTALASAEDRPQMSSPLREFPFNSQFIPTKPGFTLQDVTVQAERAVVRYLEQATGHIRLSVYSLKTGERLGELTFGDL